MVLPPPQRQHFAMDLPSKKNRRREHFEMFPHVGLLFNEPPGRTGLPFI
jgi:hypothetical protein